MSTTAVDDADQALFQTQRLGLKGYAVPVLNGHYTARLLFAELTYTTANTRVFDVTAEGTTVAKGLDIWSAAGGRGKPFVLTVPVTVADGELTLRFASVRGKPTIAALEILSDTNSSATSNTWAPTTSTTAAPTTSNTEVPTTTAPATTTTAAPTTTTTATTAPTTTTTAPSATTRGCTKTAAAGEALQTFIDRLAAGDTGCLRGTLYTGSVSVERSGVTLTEVPGEQASICGRLQVTDSANDVTIADLSFDGSCAAENTVKIYGDRVTIVGNDITNRYQGKSCMMVGSASAGAAYDTVIERNVIHECGGLSGPGLDHGIYLAAPRRARVSDNVIWGTDSYGIQIYPDAQDSTFAYNVIDGSRSKSAVVIGGETDSQSNNNHVAHNIFSWNYAYGAKSYWPGAVGIGNVVENNCVWQNSSGVYGGSGFTQGTYTSADPMYVDRAGHDYRLKSGSACAGMGPRA